MRCGAAFPTGVLQAADPRTDHHEASQVGLTPVSARQCFIRLPHVRSLGHAHLALIPLITAPVQAVVYAMAGRQRSLSMSDAIRLSPALMRRQLPVRLAQAAEESRV